jgi:hypothetical protein
MAQHWGWLISPKASAVKDSLSAFNPQKKTENKSIA